MKLRRLLFASILAVVLAVTAARAVAAFYCFPLCGLYDTWDPEYYIFQCWQCPPNPPEG